MALATRCPKCQAMFRVVADQLKLRGGLVRCGTCRHVFDAIGSLTYVDDATVKSAPLDPREPRSTVRKIPGDPEKTAPLAPSPRVVAPTPKSPAPPRPREAVRPITLRITPGVGVHVRRAHTEAARHGDAHGRRTEPVFTGVPTLWVTDTQSNALAARVSAHVAPDEPVPSESASANQDATSSHASPSSPSTDSSAATVPSSHESSSSRRPRKASRRPAEPAANRAAPASTDVDDAGAQAPNDDDATDAEAAPSFLRNPEHTRGFSILYSAASVALAVAIALQLAVLFRTELMTRWPALRPTLVQICGGFGCNVGWPTRSELLAVVGTELQAVPGTDVLELTAVVRNRANFKVALPAIELTLTDTQNRPLARKVFPPVDYLASSGEPSSRIDEGLGAGSDYTVRIVFEARGLSAVGFVVYPFYL